MNGNKTRPVRIDPAFKAMLEDIRRRFAQEHGITISNSEASKLLLRRLKEKSSFREEVRGRKNGKVRKRTFDFRV